MKDNKPHKYYPLSPLSTKDFPVYFKALKDQLNDPSIKNIAITGSYGSGKSTVIDSFINQEDSDAKQKFLRVSLADFCEFRDPLKTDEVENKVEEHILQQLFYQLHQKEIPFSGFKRILHQPHSLQKSLVFEILLWLSSLFFIPNIFELIYENLEVLGVYGPGYLWQNTSWIITGINLIVLFIFFRGLFYLFMELIASKQKRQFKKIAFKSAEIELSEKNPLNKYIDELIYFFEATSKEIVIIEDLDRFKNITLFTRLREINFLLNNAPQISKSIKFVYAIKDDVFFDSLIRTKFFDFILPIVPVINITNSGDFLWEDIEKYGIKQSYFNEIGLYIHDLRLLKNILNEFHIYNTIVNHDLKRNKTNLFSLVVYKNLFPQEFCSEKSGEGFLSEVFKTRKKEVLGALLKVKLERIEALEIKKQYILEENATDEESLRKEYVFEIFKNHPGIHRICNYSIAEIVQSQEKFNFLLEDRPTISFNSNIDGPKKFLDFENIAKKVNSKKTFNQRQELVIQKAKGGLNEINSEIINIKKLIEKLRRSKLSQLIKQYKDNHWKQIIFNPDKERALTQNEELLALLLRKGYLEENFQIYISYFYPGALSFGDNEFLLNVKANEEDNFTKELTNPAEVISRIDESECEYQATLNRDIIAYLLNGADYKNNEKLKLLLEQFLQIEGAFEKYIAPLMNNLNGAKTKIAYQHLIELLVERYYPSLWNYIEDHNYDIKKKDNLIKSFLFLSENNLKRLNAESGDYQLKQYLSEKSDFLDVFNTPAEIDNVIKLIRALNLKLKKQYFKNYKENKVFNYIYENTHYELNKEMLQLMLFHKYSLSPSEFDQTFNNQNFTCIIETQEDSLTDYVYSNFSAYIENVYLSLESIQAESEFAVAKFIELLGDGEDEEKSSLLYSVLGKVSTQIADLKEFGNQDKWSLLFEVDCVKINWTNPIYYFALKESVLNNTLIKWLNNKVVGLFLPFPNELSSENYPKLGDDLIKPFQKSIIECEDLSINIYENYIKSFRCFFSSINLNEISGNKILVLINFGKIEFNKGHYDQIIERELYDVLTIFAVENIDTFINDYEDFEFSLQLHIALLETKKISSAQKKQLISLVHLENINNERLADLIGNNFYLSKEKSIEKEKLIKVMLHCENQELILKLLDKFFFDFDFEEIDTILITLGSNYKKASKLQHHPKWPKDNLHLSIANKLVEIEYLKTVNTEKYKNKIQLNVRYK
ncbi:YobI family P-loop NTPase [Marinilabilia salmonicolor]|uniref:YobI family P-loop NTPase n=1 Tax=Marinilabilia salmonicolor TaxID=989 RepID=UPI00029A9615|nr:P-loop NTPase fold protein [Marinilabilia salmonicolor]